MKELAWIFTIIGLAALAIAIFDRKESIGLRLFFGLFGALYAFTGIMLIIKL